MFFIIERPGRAGAFAINIVTGFRKQQIKSIDRQLRTFCHHIADRLSHFPVQQESGGLSERTTSAADSVLVDHMAVDAGEGIRNLQDLQRFAVKLHCITHPADDSVAVAGFPHRLQRPI